MGVVIETRCGEEIRNFNFKRREFPLTRGAQLEFNSLM
jgi:hypothetical protein